MKTILSELGGETVDGFTHKSRKEVKNESSPLPADEQPLVWVPI